MPDLATVIEQILIIIGAGLGVWFGIRKNSKDIKATEERVSKKIDFVAYKVNGLFDVILDSLPYPAWIKQAEIKDGIVSFKMRHLNRAYEDLFKIKRHEYFDRTDFEVWPSDVAQKFYANDMAVLGSKRPLRVKEHIGAFGIIQETHESINKPMEFEKLYVRYGDKEFIIGFLRPTDYHHLEELNGYSSEH